MPRTPLVVVALVYVVTCLALWPFPLFGILHAESSAVVAGVGFFASGLAALVLFRRGARFGSTLIWLVALLAVPWALLTLSLAWRPNCGYWQGLLLFLTFTVPSVGLATTFAYALNASALRFRAGWFVLGGLLTTVLPVLYDLGLHPQFYTYNHVFGGVLGPVYDEELSIRPGLFFFRGLTVWWAVWLLLAGRRAKLRREDRSSREARHAGLGLLAVSLVIVGTYSAAPWLGFNTPGWYIQDRLGGHLELERFDIYYDPNTISEGELAVIADIHRYRYYQLREELGTDVPIRLATYLYPDPDTKGALTGARYTSVAPTWLPTPQVHLLQDRFEASFAHELAHAMAREFGMPILRASPAIGLVEGLAVAVEPPDGLPPAHAQVAAALRHREALGVYTDSLAADVAAQLTPRGFWTGRGAVSYTTMGSFVRYLLDAYGPEQLQQAYATGNIEAAYGKPVETLAQEWERFLMRQPEDPEALAIVQARFTRPSLFEQRCPHYVPPSVRHLRRGSRALEAGEADIARQSFAAALRADSANVSALISWSRLALLGEEADEARAQLERAAARADTLASPALLARLGDARRLAGEDDAAEAAYAAAHGVMNPHAHESRATLALRQSLSTEALRELLGPASSAARAAQLEPLGGAATVMAALLWAEAGEFERAATLMDAALLVSGIEPQMFAWRSAFTHAVGNHRRAALLADNAAGRFEAQGALAAAELHRDRAALLWWFVFNQPEA